MTKTIEQARREAFEAKYPLLNGMYWCDETKQYAGNSLFWLYSDRWEAWNAALDSLCVELPKEYPRHPKVRQDRNKAIDDCREAIHAAGVKTR